MEWRWVEEVIPDHWCTSINVVVAILESLAPNELQTVNLHACALAISNLRRELTTWMVKDDENQEKIRREMAADFW